MIKTQAEAWVFYKTAVPQISRKILVMESCFRQHQLQSIFQKLATDIFLGF